MLTAAANVVLLSMSDDEFDLPPRDVG